MSQVTQWFAVSESSYKIKLLCLYLYLFYPFLIIVETITENDMEKNLNVTTNLS